MALQGDYITQDTVDHPECYARIEGIFLDRIQEKVRYNVTLYHNLEARNIRAPMFTMYLSGDLNDYISIDENDVIKRAYVHLKSIPEGMFSAWSDV